MALDLVIIGAGPAGIAAAIYAKRNNMNLKIISADIGGQMATSGLVENYIGIKSTDGPSITEMFHHHAKDQDIEITYDTVLSINKENNIVKIEGKKEVYLTKSVLIATGSNPKRLNIPGEKELANKGVGYCATCDGPLFRNKKVAIIGGGNSALDAALQLANLASHVYIINKNPKMKGDSTLFEKVNSFKNVEFIYNALSSKILGDKVVSGLEFIKDNNTHSIEVEGIFVQIGLLPNSKFINIVEKNEFGEIIIDRENRTSESGIFAAGDVTDISEKQIIIAAGEGAKASLSIFKYVNS